MKDEIEVVELTEDEWVQSIKNSLRRLGLTYDELRAQAESEPCGCCGFTSLRARLLWQVIKPAPGTDRAGYSRVIERIRTETR